MAEQAPPRPLPVPPKRGRGRPDRLTPDIANMILAAVANNQRVEVAWTLAGVSKSGFYGWLQVAAGVRMAAERGEPLPRAGSYERRCLDFSDSLARAMAQAEGFGIRDVVNAGSQPVVERREVTRCAGLDSNGAPVMVTETTVVTKPPDWRARAWWLEARHPDAYGRRRVELSGPGGGPIPVEMAHRLATLADTIREFQEEEMGAIGPG